MYESHFGITAPPFQLSPDPSFFFSSQGHQGALSELRRGFDAGARVIVVYGEMGVGKTTLIHAAAAELDPAWAVVAQIAGSGLDDVGLLHALQTAFGFQVDLNLRERKAIRLGEFVAALGRDYRRPVLIIDDAHALRAEAFQLLVTLQALWPIGLAPLQVCLVGRPELLAKLDSTDQRQLKALVQVSCDLGPLQETETSAYIEHRLKAVGWSGIPSFEPGAFEKVFHRTAGVPRRINLLCDRLFLSRFLAEQEQIESSTVEAVANELGEEVSEPLLDAVGATPVGSVVDHCGERSERDSALSVTTEPIPVPHPVRPFVRKTWSEEQSLTCVVGGHGDHVRAAALLQAFAERQDLPASRLVRVFTNHAFDYNKALFADAGLAGRVLNLGIAPDSYAGRATDVMVRFEAVFDDCHPAAVIVFDGSDAALGCTRVASRRNVPVAHIGAGQRHGVERGAIDNAIKQIDQLSAVLYAADSEAVDRLSLQGIPDDRIQVVGNLVADSLKHAMRVSSDRPRIPDVFEPAVQDLLVSRRGYGVVLVDAEANTNDAQNLADLVTLVRTVSRDLPLLWPMHARLREQLAVAWLDAALAIDNVVCAPMQHYAAYVRLLSAATCVLTDSSIVQDEATGLKVPCLMIGVTPEFPVDHVAPNLFVGNDSTLAVRAVWDRMFNGDKGARRQHLGDGQAAARIARHLAEWLHGQE
jgi:general secretion pathway protein A